MFQEPQARAGHAAECTHATVRIDNANEACNANGMKAVLPALAFSEQLVFNACAPCIH